MNNFFQRVLSGVIFVGLLLFSISFSPYTFVTLFAIITGLGLYEFHKMTLEKTDKSILYLGIVGGLLLFTTFSLGSVCASEFPFTVIYSLYFIVVLVAQLFRKKANVINNWSAFVLGQAIVALPFSLLNDVLFSPTWQPVLLLAMFLTIWVNDSFAYVFGVTLGRHKMFPRVSPKKSWEGFVGGAVMSLLMAYLCWKYLPMLFPKINFTLVQWMIFAEIVVVFGTLGDLLESQFKRTYGVKDSSNLIPGHGGILDRFDSMLLATPAICIYIQVLQYLN